MTCCDLKIIRLVYCMRLVTFLPARELAVVECLSLCLCVSVSHAGIVSKRLNVGSSKQHHMIAQTPTVVGGRPLPLKFALKVTHPL